MRCHKNVHNKKMYFVEYLLYCAAISLLWYHIMPPIHIIKCKYYSSIVYGVLFYNVCRHFQRTWVGRIIATSSQRSQQSFSQSFYIVIIQACSPSRYIINHLICEFYLIAHGEPCESQHHIISTTIQSAVAMDTRDPLWHFIGAIVDIECI